ncbi:hypothetical protein Pan14r_41030 [Crateriforma conspicua]|uniref:Uncharacterized protein n=1 Tax=Crateriforma conspicua TaxID=2527996 RepID=A0A5C5Y7Y3_9PLAN|nr:hypothetical protein Pan14r_41030 [Crateriforma conspicua]
MEMFGPVVSINTTTEQSTPNRHGVKQRRLSGAKETGQHGDGQFARFAHAFSDGCEGDDSGRSSLGRKGVEVSGDLDGKHTPRRSHRFSSNDASFAVVPCRKRPPPVLDS